MERSREDAEFHHVFDRVTDAYIALDKDWRYTYLNAKACELLGRRKEDLIGKNIWNEFPEGVDQPFHGAYEKAMAEQQPVFIEAFYAPYQRWFENRIYPSADGLTIYFRDITEHKRGEQIDAGQHDILIGIAAQQPLADSLERIARLHEALNPGALCSVLLLDDAGERLLHGAGPSLPETYIQTVHGMQVGDARGSCGTAAWNRKRVVVADISTHPYWEHSMTPALAHGLKACWSTPVFGSAGQVLGTFAVYYRECREPRPDELANIDRLLPITGIAIESAKLIKRLLERDRFFDLSMEIYCIFDPKSERIIQVNPSFSRVTGYSTEELTSRQYMDFVHPDDHSLATNAVGVLAAGGRVSEFTYRFLCKDGSYRWLEWESVAAPDGLAFAVARDITERRRAEEKLAYAASHDSVTGLLHHLLLESALASILEEGPTSVWVLFIGLDRFQVINDSMGHVMGDDVLQRLAWRLQESLGEEGQIARFAGDRFIVVARDLSHSAALALADRLRAAVAEPVEGHDYKLLLTASIGISHSPDHGKSPRELLRRAEAAMQVVKREGRDGVREFSIVQMQDLEDRLTLGGHLRDAIRQDEFELHYQPQYSAGAHALIGFEALLRWNSKKLGSVSPGRFIPIAETLGLMPEIGEWVLNAACRQARDWLDRGHRGFSIAVNVSAQQLQRPGLVEHVRETISRYAVPPDVLDIELTESSLMENVARVQRTLADLKALGTRLSLDDFGTGYSSLAYLKQFPIDKLKIDQSFVRGLPHDADDAAIAQTIIAMAHQLRMLVAAEGVETGAQSAFLTGIGCDELQGYHLGRPVIAQEAEGLFVR